MVPPSATLNAVDASKFTEIGFVAGGLEGSSQPSAPLSPVETKYVIPCAADCSASPEANANCALEAKSSQLLKLSVMISLRLLSTMYSSERSMPSVVLVEPETTKST